MGDAAPVSTVLHHTSVGGAGIVLTTDAYSSSFRRYAVFRDSNSSGGLISVLDLLLVSLAILLNLPAVANANIFETEEVMLFATVPSNVVPYVQSWYNALFERPFVIAWTESVSPSLFWSGVFCAIVAVRVFLRLFIVHREEVVAMRGVGLQLTNYSVTGAVVSRKFIDQDLVRSVFIHEGYFRHQAVFFLGVVVENEGHITVLFEQTLPRLVVLRAVLCGIHHVLFQEMEQGPSLAEMAGSNGAT